MTNESVARETAGEGGAIKNRIDGQDSASLESDLKNNRERNWSRRSRVFKGRELSLPSTRHFIGAGEAKEEWGWAGGGGRARE